MARHKIFREGFPPASEPDPSVHTKPGDFALDLNTASFEELSRLPMLGVERARALILSRPITSWAQVQHLPDFDAQIVKDLKKGGARFRKAA